MSFVWLLSLWTYCHSLLSWCWLQKKTSLVSKSIPLLLSALILFSHLSSTSKILSCVLHWKMWFEKYWIIHFAVQLTHIWCVCLPVERKPTIANLTISGIAWDGFTASWSPTGGDFDSFIIEVTNMENFAESQNLTLSGNALSLGISGLNPNSSYMVGLYGMHQGSFLEPLYIEATTGTCNLLCCSSTSFSFLLKSCDFYLTQRAACTPGCMKQIQNNNQVSISCLLFNNRTSVHYISAS